MNIKSSVISYLIRATSVVVAIQTKAYAHVAYQSERKRNSSMVLAPQPRRRSHGYVPHRYLNFDDKASHIHREET